MVDAYINCGNTNKRLKEYMFSYLDIITTISSIMLIRANTEESLQKKKELLESLEMYYKVFFLGDIPEEELKKTPGSEE